MNVNAYYTIVVFFDERYTWDRMITILSEENKKYKPQDKRIIFDKHELKDVREAIPD